VLVKWGTNIDFIPEHTAAVVETNRESTPHIAELINSLALTGREGLGSIVGDVTSRDYGELYNLNNQGLSMFSGHPFFCSFGIPIPYMELFAPSGEIKLTLPPSLKVTVYQFQKE
jgi:hypothetical protein